MQRSQKILLRVWIVLKNTSLVYQNFELDHHPTETSQHLQATKTHKFTRVFPTEILRTPKQNHVSNRQAAQNEQKIFFECRLSNSTIETRTTKQNSRRIAYRVDQQKRMISRLYSYYSYGMKPEEFPTLGSADVLTEVLVLTPQDSLRLRAW